MRIFKLPDLGEGLHEAEVVEWRVTPGDAIAIDAPLVAVETAKAVVEIPSPFAGRIERLFASIGDIVHIGAPLVGFKSEAGEAEEVGSIVGSIESGSRLVTELMQPRSHANVGVRAPTRPCAGERPLKEAGNP